GFYKADYDDSKWFNQPVPYTWTERFGHSYGHVKGAFPYVPSKNFIIHEGWYRRSFKLPEKWKTGQTLLHFRGVANKAAVYVNGEKVLVHENISPGHLWIGSGNTEDRFFCNITPYLKDGSNVLAVKVFSSSRNGGIWQTVYLERKENLYTEKILPSSDYRAGKIKLRVFFVNTQGEQRPRLTFEFKPWNSFRYHRDWEPQSFTVEAKPIPAGESEQTFSFVLKKPQLWSPENRNLYHLIVKDSAGKILGQERFGFRTFELGKNCFLLNGKRIFPMGENSDIFGWAFPGNYLMNYGFGVLNKDRLMEKNWERYMGCGNTIFRGNGIMPLDMQMDFADEQGLLFTMDGNFPVEEDRVTPRHITFQNGKAVLSEGFRSMIRQRCFTLATHPSAVLHTIANEAFEKNLYNSRWEKTGWTPILNACYDEYKKWLPEMPIGSSSGRGWKKGPDIYHKNIGIAKADYDVCHPYGVNRSLKKAELDSYHQGYMEFKKAYALDHGSPDRPMFVGESAEFYTFNPNNTTGGLVTNRRKKDFKIKNGEFDREWLARNLRVVNRKYLSEACEYSLIPLVDSVNPDEAYRIQGWHNRQIMEQFRRLRHVVAGYTLHLPAIFKDGSYAQYNRPTYDSAKLAQQPVLACFSGFAPRNLLAGKPFESEVYLINDTEKVLKQPEVSLSLKDGTLEKKIVFPDIQPGCLAKLPVTFDFEAPEGENVIYLSVFEQGKPVGKNEFEIFVQDPVNWSLAGRQTPLVLIGRDAKFEQFLKDLNAEFTCSQRAPDDYSSVLIVLPGCSEKKLGEIAKWISEGEL
ncbi:MAG: hypothetical protein IKO93_13895, partial [Lentisphaeria bacterium]|nr:hypothetical protein [Lentisphaeria bacterium]